MKTTLLFSAAILFSAASFAQTAVSNKDAVKSATSAQGDKNGVQLKDATSASSSTSVQTKAVSNAATKTRSAAVKTEKAAVTEKKELAVTAATKGQEAKKAVPQHVSASAGVQSNDRVTAHAITPKPASVRVNTHIKAGAGVRIK